MKKILKLVTVLALVFGLMTTIAEKNPALAAATRDTGLEVTGDSHVINISQAQSADKLKVTFTFKTTHADFEGFISGAYAIKYDATRMDYVAGSIAQAGGMGIANEDWKKITIDGAPATEGTLLMAFAAVSGGQNYDLTLEFNNLFKDGTRAPLEVSVINRTEDLFTVWDLTNPAAMKPYRPTTPVLTPAKISLVPLSVTVNGVNSVQKGQSTTYTTTVRNELADNGVNWTITGANDVGTVINAAGELTVAKTETASSIEVVATAKEDTTVIVNKTVSLTNPPELGVSISGPSQVVKGTKGNNFIGNVVNAANKAVVWELTGQNSPKTRLDTNGKLTVGIDETASALNIKATSVEDGTKLSTTTVNLIEKTYTVKNIDLPDKNIEMESGATEDQLHAKASRNGMAKVTIETNDGQIYIIDVPTVDYRSDKDVVDEDGVIMDGKFKLNYTLELPHISIDENGVITQLGTATNIVGEPEVSIDVRIGEEIPEVEIPEVEMKPDNDPSQGNNGNDSNSGGNNTGTKEPIHKLIQTGDAQELGIYAIAAIGSIVVLIACFIMHRKKEDNK